MNKYYVNNEQTNSILILNHDNPANNGVWKIISTDHAWSYPDVMIKLQNSTETVQIIWEVKDVIECDNGDIKVQLIDDGRAVPGTPIITKADLMNDYNRAMRII